MKNKLVRVTAMSLLFGMSVYAQEEQTQEKTEALNEVVVVATKFDIDKEKVGKIIYQITAEDLKNSKGKTVADVLDNLAGVQIFGNNSAAGKNKSINMRGGRGYQTVVLVDGIPLNDPSGINNAFDIRLLTINQVESIEVMNGAASTLYGSGAATGVINIKLKAAAKKPVAMQYQTSVGTNNSQDDNSLNVDEVNQNIGVNGSFDKFNYLVNLNVSLADGLSDATDQNSITSFEKDKFQATNSYVRLGYDFTEKLNVTVFHNFDKDVYDYDAGPYTDSEINNGENKQQRFGLTSNYKYEKGSVKLVASYNQNDRLLNEFSSWTNTTNNFEYTGKSVYVDVANDYKFNNLFQLITGINYQDQSNQTNSPYGEIDEDLANFNMIDPYATLVYNSKGGFNINAGARLNIHSEYGTHWVYNVNPSYNFTNNFRVLASYSTAFISPSTYQLFSQYGNLDLEPEEDSSIEAGFVYGFKQLVNLNAVFFYREMENAIIFGANNYENAIGTMNVKGVEMEVKIDPARNVNVILGYTYSYKSDDIDYIPNNKFTALIETTSIKNTYLSLQFQNISERTYFDQWGTGDIIELKPYSILDFYGSYEIIKGKVSVFGEVNNIFNEDYVEVIGYTTKGRNYRIGLDFSF
jgi:vitamin B12 transporter